MVAGEKGCKECKTSNENNMSKENQKIKESMESTRWALHSFDTSACFASCNNNGDVLEKLHDMRTETTSIPRNGTLRSVPQRVSLSLCVFFQPFFSRSALHSAWLHLTCITCPTWRAILCRSVAAREYGPSWRPSAFGTTLRVDDPEDTLFRQARGPLQQDVAERCHLSGSIHLDIRDVLQAKQPNHGGTVHICEV